MIVKTYDVFCDVESQDCYGWADSASNTESATEARRRAKNRGWRRVGGRDICPACQAVEKGQE